MSSQTISIWWTIQLCVLFKARMCMITDQNRLTIATFTIRPIRCFVDLKEMIQIWTRTPSPLRPKKVKLTLGLISFWETEKVMLMSGLFHSCRDFHEDISRWNVSQVQYMNKMFYHASSFEGKNLSSWNVSNVIDMRYMFCGAARFNAPIGNWNVGKVQNMDGMFMQAERFDQPLEKWDVRNVRSMQSMFQEARFFNQNLLSWKLDSLQCIERMFYLADSMMNGVGDLEKLRQLPNYQFIFTKSQPPFNVPFPYIESNKKVLENSCIILHHDHRHKIKEQIESNQVIL